MHNLEVKLWHLSRDRKIVITATDLNYTIKIINYDNMVYLYCDFICENISFYDPTLVNKEDFDACVDSEEIMKSVANSVYHTCVNRYNMYNNYISEHIQDSTEYIQDYNINDPFIKHIYTYYGGKKDNMDINHIVEKVLWGSCRVKGYDYDSTVSVEHYLFSCYHFKRIMSGFATHITKRAN